MNFNTDGTCLCVSSDHGTIHLFSLDQETLNKQPSLVSSIIPKYFSSNCSLCKITVPDSPPCICAFGAENNSVIGKYTKLFVYTFILLTVLVVCANGSFYKYSFNLETGESVLEETAQFLELTGEDS